MLTTGTRCNIRGNRPTIHDPASRVQGVFFLALIQNSINDNGNNMYNAL